MPTDSDPSLAQPGPSVPDHVPDDLVARYGRRAEHQVRYRRSQRYRVSFQARQAFRPLADSAVWMQTVIVFFWMVVAAAIVGGLAYAIAIRPWVGLFIVGPLAAMFAASLIVAVRMQRRNEPPDEPIIRLP